MRFPFVAGGLLCLAAWNAAALGQNATPPSPEPLPTAEQVAEFVQEVESAPNLDDALKASIKQLYQQATSALEATAKAAKDAARFEQMTQDAPASLRETAAALNAIPKQPRPIDSALTLPQLQQRLAEVDAEILRHRETLAKLNGDVSARQVRQREVPGELEAARGQLDDIKKQLTTAAPANENALLTKARGIHLRTQSALLAAKTSALEKELPAYAATAELLPKQRDLAGEQLSLAEATKKLLAARIDELRRSDVRSQVDEALQGVKDAPQQLRSIAERTLDYVRKNQAMLQNLKGTADDRAETERELNSVDQEFQRTREKVDSVGLTDTLGILLRARRADLLAVRSEHEPDRSRRSKVRELHLTLLQLEDVRTDMTQLDQVTTETLEDLKLDVNDRALQTAARGLLKKQRDALDSLLQNQRDYFESLVALDNAERELVQLIDEFASYIDGWILWVRSVPPLSLNDLRDALTALQWLSSPAEWAKLVTIAWSALRKRLVFGGVIVIVFLLLVWRQWKFRVRLGEVGEIAAPRRCRVFSVTVEATILTILIAAVWPTGLFFVGWQLASAPESSVTIEALGWAFVASGSYFLLIEVVRQLVRSRGLAESHFGWPDEARRILARNLRWFALTVPLVFVVVFLRSQPNEVFDHSLGRFCFLILMIGVGILTVRTLRPGGRLMADIGQQEPVILLYRMRYPIFGVSIGMAGVLFGLAASGYYYTSLQLAARLMVSLAVVATLVVLMGMLLRWVLIHRRRLIFAQKMAARQRAVQGEASEAQTDFLTEAETAVDMVQVTRQTRELIRMAIIVTTFLAGWWIWDDVLPALDLLASFEVWRLNLPTRIEIITMKQLFMCLLTFLLTFIAVKNIPGLLELLFLQRLPLDPGARYAVTTIVRYLLAVIGVVIAFGFIKVQWSQYSWVVAAATVGLGFGLQEIFGNFVSGLIVLLERPIRVGDVVTVDGTTGVVQQVHMRATVLKNWDHQELIVPNKEFVTTKILNWTLSNATNRVVINVGVAYGSDVKLAREVMLRVVTDEPSVLEDPGPSVTFDTFADSALNFVVRCYIPQLDGRLATINDLHAELYRQLNEAGIEIAFPQRDLHIRSMPPGWLPAASSGPSGQNPEPPGKAAAP